MASGGGGGDEVAGVRSLATALRDEQAAEAALDETEQIVRRQTSRSEAAKTHSYACAVLLQGLGVKGREAKASSLLRCLGPAQALLVTYRNAPRVDSSSIWWLVREVKTAIADPSLLYQECLPPSTTPPSSLLSPDQEHLVAAICHLPDALANRLHHSLPPSLLPSSFFLSVGSALLACLRRVYDDIRGGVDCCLAFPAALLAKAALQGHAEVVLLQIVPTLEEVVVRDPLWRRISHSLFCRLSTSSLEPVLTALVQLVSPSLSSPHPLYLLLGNLALTNHRARLVVSHKLWLTRVPSQPDTAYNLIGYLRSWDEGCQLLGSALEAALGVWSDISALRRMDGRQHGWICRLLVLGTTVLGPSLGEKQFLPLAASLRKLVMSGIQAHLECPLEGVRVRGLAVGQSLINTLHTSTLSSSNKSTTSSSSANQQLQFNLEETGQVGEILKLTRPLEEQQRQLLAQRTSSKSHDHHNRISPQSREVVNEDKETEEERGGEGLRYGQGMALAVEASSSDSDDDLEPYAMPDEADPRHTNHHYLRSCLQALLSPSDTQSLQNALSATESLVRSDPCDLHEVCGELAKVLLHLQNSYDLPSFPALRHAALVALCVQQPRCVVPYLTTEFYSPNHSLRQRMDILEVLSAAAKELSSPSPSSPPHPSPPQPSPSSPVAWRQVVDARVKAKTRLISKGPLRPPPSPTPSRFSSLATLFFFPLLSSYDCPLPSLDLLGRDTLLLGNLLHTLSTVLFAAVHSPAEPAMAAALLEVTWTLRYHPSSFIRQAVLCALGTVVVATPTTHLMRELDTPLTEAMQWVQDMCVGDADDEVRTLAKHTVSLMGAIVREETMMS